MIDFFVFYKAELYKSTKSDFVFLCLILPLVIIIYSAYYVLMQADNLEQGGFNPWMILARESFLFYSFAYPFMAIVISYMLISVENKNHGFRLLFSYPISRKNIFDAKVMTSLFWLTNSLILGYLLIFMVGFLFGIFLPELKFSDYSAFEIVTTYFFDILIYSSLISILHLCLNLISESFVVTTILGVLLLFVGFFLYKSDFSLYIPYTYGFRAMSKSMSGYTFLNTTENYLSLGLICAFYSIGILIINTRK